MLKPKLTLILIDDSNSNIVNFPDCPKKQKIKFTYDKSYQIFYEILLS